MFARAISVLASPCIAAALEYFNKLGFENHDCGDQGYGIAVREHVELHIWLCTDRHIDDNTSCHVRVND